MNDLLNEDEFSSKVYNPKRWFNTFYLCGSLLSLSIFAMVRFYRELFNNATATLAIVLTFLLPLILSLVMVFSKKKNILLLFPKNAAYHIFILFGFCCASVLSLGIAASIRTLSNLSLIKNILYTILVIAGIYFIIYLITIAIILPILKRSQKLNRSA